MCTRAGGKDPVPCHCKGAMERTSLQREQERAGKGLHPTHPHSLLFPKVAKTSSQVRGKRSCPGMKLGWRRTDKSGQERYRVCPEGEQAGQSIAHPLHLRLRAACPWGNTPGHRAMEINTQAFRRACTYLHTYTQTHTYCWPCHSLAEIIITWRM